MRLACKVGVKPIKRSVEMRKFWFMTTAGVCWSLMGSAAWAQVGNADAGEDVFKKCHACHDVGPEAKSKVGPVLNGIVGRKVGSMPGFSYSDANKGVGEKGAVWSEEELFKYLENPLAYMPKTKMIFAGLKDEQDRRDVIEYLKKYK